MDSAHSIEAESTNLVTDTSCVLTSVIHTHTHTKYFTLVVISRTSKALEDKCVRTISVQSHTLLLHTCNEDSTEEL